MRVITGTARGRRLKEPKNMDIRPTTDMVKEAMFNIVQYDVEGRRVLDLFAGTGQLGIEALSRGAAEVVFLDADKESVKLIRENIAHCGFEARVEQTDSLAYLERCDPFDLIFIDPPYDTELLDKAMEKIMRIDILSEGGIIICESRREKKVPEARFPYKMRYERSYGKVKLTIYEKEV